MISSGKILVIGRNGQVGSALTRLLGDRAISVDRQQVDLSRPELLPEALKKVLDPLSEPPCAVINAAAYTQVDRAETEAALSEAINADSPGVLAGWCRERGIPLVHYSTDYVFPGTGETPWREEDPTGPLNAYGAAKLRGEKLIAQNGGKWLIFRTSWVYDTFGKNFLRTMLRLGQEREELKVVADQFGAPTYAPHLAVASLQALNTAAQDPSKFPSGVYHLCNMGVTTWHGFAEKIFAEAKARGLPRAHQLKIRQVLPLRTEEYPTPAQRPRNSRLNTDKAFRILGLRLPEWEQGLRECLDLFERNGEV